MSLFAAFLRSVICEKHILKSALSCLSVAFCSPQRLSRQRDARHAVENEHWCRLLCGHKAGRRYKQFPSEHIKASIQNMVYMSRVHPCSLRDNMFEALHL
jgi:hypothetical protein